MKIRLSVEQVMRIELTTTAWEAVVLPLNYTCELVMRICLSRVAALFGENDGGKSVPAARTELTTTACLLFCH